MTPTPNLGPTWILYALQTKGNMMRTSIATSILIFLMALSMLSLNMHGLADDQKPDVNQYLGTWRMIAVIVDGKDLPPGSQTLNTVTADGWTVTKNGDFYSKGTSKRDPQFPSHSDVKYVEGALAGTTLKQILKIEGDVMIACIGEKRPTEFKSKAGSGNTLSVWIRVK